MLNFITGGVCAAQGFRAGGILHPHHISPPMENW